MKLKICGMRDKDNIKDLLALQPDYMGFIFWERSPRYVDKLTPPLPDYIKKTGVFVDAKPEYIQSTIKNHKLNAVQLHGEETPVYCSLIKKFGVEIIKAFSIKNQFEFNTLSPYEEHCDYFLFDTKGGLPGGNGYAFDWKMLSDYYSKKPFFLSGGIGPNDIKKIKALMNTELPLFAIDINSKFEHSPGFKNTNLIAPFKKKIDEL